MINKNIKEAIINHKIVDNTKNNKHLRNNLIKTYFQDTYQSQNHNKVQYNKKKKIFRKSEYTMRHNTSIK